MTLPSTIHDFTDLTLPEHITTVLLDFDNTCYSYEACHTLALAALEQALQEYTGSLSNFAARYQAAQATVKKRIPGHGASHSRALYIQTLLEQADVADTITPVPRLEAVYWDTFQAHMQPTAGLLDFLADCQNRGKNVVVVSDLTVSIQCQKLATLGLTPWLTALVTSEEAGAEKPHPAPFLLGLEKAQSSASTAVMIGDSIEKDIEGAAALGIATIHLTHELSPQTLPVR